MIRMLGWLLLVAGAAVVVAAIAQSNVPVPLFGSGLVVAGVGAVFAGVHFDEVVPADEDQLRGERRYHREEERRRRGAAGWEKPVAPPSGPRPGGLPPRRDREA